MSLILCYLPIALFCFLRPTFAWPSNFHQQTRSNRIFAQMTSTKAALAKDTMPILLPTIGTLRVDGPDKKGIVAAFSQLLYGHGCGIVESEQHTDNQANRFFQRIKFDYTEMRTDRVSLEFGIGEVSERFEMSAELNWNDNRKKMAIMVSKYDHCLWELLLRHQAGELDCDIACIISNHPDLKKVADTFSIPFHVFKVTKATKVDVEKEEIKLLKETYDVDLVVLARYMQIISDDFCNTFPHKVINIHHSFLPAFIGAKPYHRAHERGVKLIGATAHYATADLDEGPILEQDISRISHRDAVQDLIRKGSLLEKNVLVCAVKGKIPIVLFECGLLFKIPCF
jgi:formyltetrahydrofolate deformylase